MSKIRAFKSDIEKYYLISYGTANPSIAKRIRLWIFEFGLHCVACYRFGQAADRLYKKSKLVGFVPKVLHLFLDFFMRMIHHVSIDATEIGPGFYIGHVGTIYIGPTKIGYNVSLSHNTTIGIGHAKESAGIPLIGNNIWIGTGSIISGNVIIEDGVTISSGSVLSKNIPGRSLVGGNPGRILFHDYDNRDLLVWRAADE